MTSIPTPITLDAADAKAFSNHSSKVMAVQQWVQMVTRTAEQRLAELNQDGAKLWQDAAKKYEIDIITVNWAPSQDNKTLVPLTVNLASANGQ